MKIEKAINSDAEEITKLTIRSKSHWGYSKEQIEEWRDELTITTEYIKRNQVYKFVNNSKLIGFYAYQSLNDTDIKLNFLFVDPTFIGKGYGKVLLTDFLQRIEYLRFKKVILDADPNAEEFYKQFDFKIIGQLESSIEGRFLPIMEKEIRQSRNSL